MYGLKPEIKVPIKPHAQESHHDDPEQVQEQSSQQASMTEDKQRSSQGRTETSGTDPIQDNAQSESATDTLKTALRAPSFFT